MGKDYKGRKWDRESGEQQLNSNRQTEHQIDKWVLVSGCVPQR